MKKKLLIELFIWVSLNIINPGSKDECEKPYKINHKNIKIAVAGVSSKIGTTTTAFNMSKLLFEIGSKVSYTEANSNEHLKEIAAYYEFPKVKNYYKYKGIEYYPNKQFPDDYNFNIFDLGIIDSRSTAIFNSCDIKILCSGNKPYELIDTHKAIELS